MFNVVWRWWTHALPVLQPLVKQDSLDTYNERDPFKNDDARDEEDDAEDVDSGIEGEVDPLDRDVIIQPPPPPPPLRPPTERVTFPKGLPWAPKVRWGRSSASIVLLFFHYIITKTYFTYLTHY